MFIRFVIERELALKSSGFLLNNKNLGIAAVDNTNTLTGLINFNNISFSKPKLVSFSNKFFSFFVLSNGALVIVDFSFNGQTDQGLLLFEDLFV